jgi:hypothetical protein
MSYSRTQHRKAKGLRIVKAQGRGVDPRTIGMAGTTPCACSCWLCTGGRREHAAYKLAKSGAAFTWEV